LGYGDDAGFDFGNDGFGFDYDEEMDIDAPELSLNERQEAIIESIRKIVPDYWDRLYELPFSHVTITERCFVVEEFNPKTARLKVYLLL